MCRSGSRLRLCLVMASPCQPLVVMPGERETRRALRRAEIIRPEIGCEGKNAPERWAARKGRSGACWIRKELSATGVRTTAGGRWREQAICASGRVTREAIMGRDPMSTLGFARKPAAEWLAARSQCRAWVRRREGSPMGSCSVQWELCIGLCHGDGGGCAEINIITYLLLRRKQKSDSTQASASLDPSSISLLGHGTPRGPFPSSRPPLCPPAVGRSVVLGLGSIGDSAAISCCLWCNSVEAGGM